MIDTQPTSPFNYLFAWAVHIFTASAAFVGLLTLVAIHHHEYHKALVLMAICVLIDALDGTFARLSSVKTVLPNIDGALLDNIVDYLNFVITPAFFLYINERMLPANIRVFVIIALVIASLYQFCQTDAKTSDHFFKGFPCYWNIAVFYLFIFEVDPAINAGVLSIFILLVFVPILYVYPSRLDCLFPLRALKIVMHGFSIGYALATAMILWEYPSQNPLWLGISLAYIAIYIALSMYRTFFKRP